MKALVAALVLGIVPLTTVAQTVLDNYVSSPDPNFFWEKYDEDGDFFATADTYFLRVVSGQWRSAAEVDYPIWEHELKLTVPRFDFCDLDNDIDTIYLFISGGNNPRTGVYSDNTNDGLAEIATSLCAAVAELRQVPNQPLSFADEPIRERKEDEILAYSMNKFLETGDPTWPVQLAMTRSVVAAMDAIQQFAAEDLDELDADNFIVLGGSKRGWTTWLADAADPRVEAILPISIDMLNLDEQFIHHFETYGNYSQAVEDYEEYDLGCRMLTPRGQELLEIIDPYSYRERYTDPKLIINSAGDQFFVSDSWRFYYDGLPQPKLLRYTVNTDHRQGETDQLIELFLAARSWMDDVAEGSDSPEFSWSIEPDGSIRVEVGDDPEEVVLWEAYNPTARDFRLETIGDAWTQTQLEEVEDNVYVGRVEVPAQGWRAFLVELTFDDSTTQFDQIYTTGVNILPDTLPYAGMACPEFPSYTNLWYNPVQEGQAIQIRQDGNTIGGAWYLYDRNSQGLWVNFLGTLDQSGNTATGELLRFSGPALGGPWDPSLVQSTPIGTATVRFRSTSSAEVSYTLDGVPGLLNLVPFNRLAGGPLTDIWYDPAQSGQGVQLLEDTTSVSGAWYYYGPNGEPAWLTFQGVPDQNNVVRADLLRFTGPRLDTEWDADDVQGEPVGGMRLEMITSDTVVFDYFVEGRAGTLNLHRFRLQ